MALACGLGSRQPSPMGERGLRARARCLAFAVAATLVVGGLAAPQPALAAAMAAPRPALAADTSGEAQQVLAAALQTYLSTKKGRYSVTVTELDGEQRSMSLYGARRVEPASTMKLFYAWATLRAVDEGTLTLATRLSSGISVGRCLTVMIQVSDNLCAVDLRMRIGMRKLNSLFTSEGYANTYIVLDSAGRYVTKRTSTDDLALLLARLQQGTLLSEAGTNEFKKLLLAQIWRQRISSGVAAGTVVGSKSGQLWVSTGMVEADTAVIHGAHSSYVLTVIGTHGAAGSTIRGISTIVYRYLQGDLPVKASFPLNQFATTTKVKLRTSPGGSLVKYLPQGTAVQVIYSSRTWMRVKAGTSYGWVSIQELSLRSAYRWPLPGVTADVPATGALCTVLGTSGDDILTGTSGADVICGLEGSDTIDAGAGADAWHGGSGDDLLLGGAGSDNLVGGAGLDTVSYAYIAETTTRVVADLDGSRDDGTAGEQDQIRTDVENLIGSSSDDTLTGNSSTNTLTGGPGNDSLRGGAGDDRLEGDTGYDGVDGGDGIDRCAFHHGDPVIDGSVGCEENAVRLGTPVAEMAEPLRPYSETNPDRCLVDNCGVSMKAYCIVNKGSGLVDDCVAWDGWGDAWWEGMANPPGTDSRWGAAAGPYFPEADWVIVDRSRLPEWATFVENPGSYLFSPT
jgi:Ca2+-binding RTX toxin-like protein